MAYERSIAALAGVETIRPKDIRVHFKKLLWLKDRPHYIRREKTEDTLFTLDEQGSIYELVGGNWLCIKKPKNGDSLMRDWIAKQDIYRVEKKINKKISHRIRPRKTQEENNKIVKLLNLNINAVLAYKTGGKKRADVFLKTETCRALEPYTDFVHTLATIRQATDVVDQHGGLEGAISHIEARMSHTDWKDEDYELTEAIQVIEAVKGYMRYCQ